MRTFAVFNTLTGAIVRTGLADERTVSLQGGEGERWVMVEPDVRDDTHYVSDTNLGLVALKTPLPEFDKTEIVAGGNDIARISGLPNPTEVQISFPGLPLQQATVTDGELQITSMDAGDIWVMLFPPVQYQYKEVRINAVRPA